MSKLNIATFADEVVNGKWMLAPTSYASLVKLVEQAIANPVYPELAEDNEFIVDASDATTAVININGILVKGASKAEETLFGLCNTDNIALAIDEALADESVKEIILNVNSPGGQTTGIAELGRKIVEADKIKPIFGWTEDKAASAAYWLISQCRSIGMTPSAEVGSVGVYCLITDASKALEAEGIKIEAISAGKYKLIGHPFRSLTNEEKNILQTEIDKTHAEFKAAINSRRNIKDEDLQGLTFDGQTAKEKGFVDVVTDNVNEFLTTIISVKQENMKFFTKIAAKLNPVKEMVSGEQVIKAEETPKEEPKSESIKVAEDNTVCCPHCSNKFSVEYNPEEKSEEPIKEEPKKEEPVKEEVSDKKEESNKVEEPEKEKGSQEDETDKKDKQASLSNDEWRKAFGIKTEPKAETIAFKNAISEAFKI